MRGEVSATLRAEPPPRLPQAVILEGNYWKRRIEVVMREYHKWRIYYKKRVSGGARERPKPFPLPVLGHCFSSKTPRGAPPTSYPTLL